MDPYKIDPWGKLFPLNGISNRLKKSLMIAFPSDLPKLS